MTRPLVMFLLLSALAGSTACGAENSLTPAEKEEGWQLIFDGRTTTGWMTIKEEPAPASHVQDGSLNPHPCHYMLVYEQPLRDFVLSLDFKLTPECNSGIFVRTSSLTPRPGRDVGFNGIEIAVQEGDGAGFQDMGAIYDLVKPQRNALKPLGDWNHIEITCDDNLISVVLNGAPVSKMDLDQWTEPNKRPDGTPMKFDVVYKDHPRSGYIGLQDHGGDCWYRNIKLKRLNAARSPNVLVVMTDDQGYGDFSYTGNPILKTPELDAFARQSVRLTDFHVCPMCSPTRGQLMTGVASLRNGATSVTAGRTFLRPDIPTLPETFAKAGYATGVFGKWHLGDMYPHRPIDKGFQESVYHLGWGQLLSTPEFDWPLIDGRYFHNGVEQRFQGHCTDFWFDSAMAWMKAQHDRGQPFLCYLPTNAPHSPFVELDEYVAPYQGRGAAGFFGMIAHIDQRFGDLERFLGEQGLKENTIVVFLTDNGGTAGVKTFNAGLRAGKTTYYDGGHRVPCWIRWPEGELGEPRDVNVPTQNTDLIPTLCEWCGVAPPDWSGIDPMFCGTSLAGLLQAAEPSLADRMLVVQYGQIIHKYDSCVIWNQWRLVQGKELYDVEADRAQTTDVADKHPDVVKSMRDYYDAWWAKVGPLVDEFVPISIGAKQQPIVELNSGDWEGIYADNSGYVREAVGGPTGGHWNLLVESPGRYEFTLRRWPEQTGAALGDKYEPSEKSPGNKANLQTIAFPTIARAHIQSAGVEAQADAVPSETAVVIHADLAAGRTPLQAWFSDAAGNDLCGAFYVTVRQID